MEQDLDVQVRATTDDGGHTWVVECTKCGLLGVCADTAVDPFAASHLTQSHGALETVS